MENNGKNGDIARVSSSEKLYRIRQFNGGFWIEKRLNTTKGFLWWKKPTVEWKPIDINGRICIYCNFGHGNVIDTYRIKMPPFKTMEGAKSQIEKLEVGTVFHYY